ncbi:hypothetical protein M432DRAFT_627793 [Thermoascus aurantiacus ATCC 26904]
MTSLSTSSFASTSTTIVAVPFHVTTTALSASSTTILAASSTFPLPGINNYNPDTDSYRYIFPPGHNTNTHNHTDGDSNSDTNVVLDPRRAGGFKFSGGRAGGAAAVGAYHNGGGAGAREAMLRNELTFSARMVLIVAVPMVVGFVFGAWGISSCS